MINASEYGKELDIEYLGAINSNLPAKYTITLLAINSYGNYSAKKVYVTVKNKYNYYIEPTLYLPSNTIYINKGKNFSYDIIEATSIDYRGRDISNSIRYSGKVYTNKHGLYIINFSIIDENGEITSDTVLVNVI